MKNQQSGFTLIELIMVIVILGVLAATALPKYSGFKADAETAAANYQSSSNARADDVIAAISGAGLTATVTK